MKPLTKIFFILLLLCFLSCNKNANLDGIVFSRNFIPVANVKVKLEMYKKDSDYPHRTMAEVTTTSEGRFKISIRLRNNRNYKLFCQCDSGTFRSNYIPQGPTIQEQILVLQ